jgi:hypothetical protein
MLSVLDPDAAVLLLTLLDRLATER